MVSRLVNLMASAGKGAFKLLFLAVMAGCVAFLVILVVCKLPLFVCQRCRAVRYLVPLTLVYYPAVALIATTWLGLSWWESMFFLLFGLLFCVLPDPWTFAFSPRKRRAVYAAIQYQERLGQMRPLYDQVSVLAAEGERCVLCITLEGSIRPSARKYVAVYDGDHRIEELDYEYMRDIGITFGRFFNLVANLG